MKDMAGDIMYEFYTESSLAFSLGLTALAADAAEAEAWRLLLMGCTPGGLYDIQREHAGEGAAASH